MSFLKRLFTSKDGDTSSNQKDFSEGDIFYTHSDNLYHVYKLLVFDKAFQCYHVLSYSPLDKTPAIADIENLKVAVYHSPIDKNGFVNPKFLTNKKIKANDLIGYHEYLKQTQEIKDYIPLANQYYQKGLGLTDEKKHQDAIDSYSKAIDLIPTFFEAIDNRAFCKMDLGLWKEAVEDFKLSLQGNPNSVLAEFSIGECYFKMGDYQNAKRQFEKAHQIDPNHTAPKIFLDKINKILNE